MVHHFKVSPYKSNGGSRGTELHTLMAHLRRPSPSDPPCHDVNDKDLPLDWKSACRRYGIEGECTYADVKGEGVSGEGC
jgi:hypothetical protein